MRIKNIKKGEFIFEDYTDTNVVYHIVPIIKLQKILKEGLIVNKSCSLDYLEFNSYFDRMKPFNIPLWVSRRDAIYGSLNFKKNHKWHAHSAILSVKIDEEKCWIGNESLANILYEPYVLSKIEYFKDASRLIITRGEEFIIDYWKNSISFKENIIKRMDMIKDYDAEVLIMHDVSPRDINVINIISDYSIMDLKECNSHFENLLFKNT